MTRKEKLASESVSAQDHRAWMAEVDKTTTREMVEWLKAGVEVRRPIDTLNPAAFSALAEIARAVYIRELSKRREWLKAQPAPEREQLELWLI